jgi:hypothetical protein
LVVVERQNRRNLFYDPGEHPETSSERQFALAKAAQQLNVTQPAVSKVIGDLEHTLSVRLLDRRPQGVEPTMYGRALLKRSNAVFDELKQLSSEIRSDPVVTERSLREHPVDCTVDYSLERCTGLPRPARQPPTAITCCP